MTETSPTMWEQFEQQVADQKGYDLVLSVSPWAVVSSEGDYELDGVLYEKVGSYISANGSWVYLRAVADEEIEMSDKVNS